MHIADQKTELRTATAERLKRMKPEERAAESRSLCRRLLEHIPAGSRVCGYIPLKTEPDIRPFMNALLERGDTLYLPCFQANKLVFRHATSLDSLSVGELGIPEPDIHAEEMESGGADVVLVPGRAFDAQGNRLGRGAGGYDVWISKTRQWDSMPKLIGTAYECQIVNSVPVEPHDQKMDMVMTARGPIETR